MEDALSDSLSVPEFEIGRKPGLVDAAFSAAFVIQFIYQPPLPYVRLLPLPNVLLEEIHAHD